MATKKQPVTFGGLPQVDYEGYDEWLKNQSAAQTGQQAFQQSQQNAQEEGVLDSFMNSAISGAAGSFGGTARFAGEFSPFGGETLNNFADSMDEIARRNTPTEERTGVNYVAGAIGSAVGSMASTMAEAAVVYGIGSVLGAAAGTTALGSATVAAIRGSSAYSRLAGAAGRMWSSTLGKMLLGEIAGSPFEASAEAGNLITEMRQEGYTDDEIRTAALKSASYNMAWLSVANALEAKGAMRVAKGLAGTGKEALGVVDRSLKGMGKKAGQAALLDAAGEGIEEMGQEAIGTWAKDGFDAELDANRILDAGAQGAIGGAFLGGARQAVNGLTDDSRRAKIGNDLYEASNPYSFNGKTFRDFTINGDEVSANDFASKGGLSEEEIAELGSDRKAFAQETISNEIAALPDGDKSKATLERILKRDDTEQMWQAAKKIYEKGPHFEIKEAPENNVEQQPEIQQEIDDYSDDMIGEQSPGYRQGVEDYMAQAQDFDNNLNAENYVNGISGNRYVPPVSNPSEEQHIGQNIGNKPSNQDKYNTLSLVGKKLDNVLRQAFYGSEKAKNQLKQWNISQDYINKRFAELAQEKAQMEAKWQQNAANGEELVAPVVAQEQVEGQPQQQPVQETQDVQSQADVKPKSTYVGSATAYKEPGHKWKGQEKTQADLDAIIEDIKVNGGNYNMNTFPKQIEAKLRADLGTGSKGQKPLAQSTIDTMVKDFNTRALAAKKEWKANKPSKKHLEQPKPSVEPSKEAEQPIKPVEELKPTDKPVEHIETINDTSKGEVKNETNPQTASEVSGSEAIQNPSTDTTSQSSKTETDNQTENQDSETPLGFHDKIGEWETNTSATKDGSGEEQDVAGKKKKAVGARHYYKRADGSVGVIYHNIAKNTYRATVNGKTSDFNTLDEAEQYLKDAPKKEATATPAPQAQAPESKFSYGKNMPKKMGKHEQEKIQEGDFDDKFLKKNDIASVDDIALYGPFTVFKHEDGSVTVNEEDNFLGVTVDTREFDSIEEAQKFLDTHDNLTDKTTEEVEEEQDETGSLDINLESEDEVEEKPDPKPQPKKSIVDEKQRKFVEKLSSFAEKCGVRIEAGNENILKFLKKEFPDGTFEEQEDGSIKAFDGKGGSYILDTEVDNNIIFLTDKSLSAKNAVGEFARLWNSIIRKQNPQLWHKIAKVLQKTSKWKELINSPKYQGNEQFMFDKIADDTMAWLVGENAEKRFKELENEGTPTQVINKLKSALKAYWSKVKDLFHEKLGIEFGDISQEEIANMPLADLLEGRVNVDEITHKENQHVDSVVNKTDDKLGKNTGNGNLQTIINSLSKDIKPVIQAAFDDANTEVSSVLNAMDMIDDIDFDTVNSVLNDNINEILKGKPFSEMPNAKKAFHNYFSNELKKAYDKKQAAAEKAQKEAEKATKKKAEEETKAQKAALKEAGESEQFADYKDFALLLEEQIDFFKQDSGITGVSGVKDNLPFYAVVEKLANAENAEYGLSYYTELLNKLSEIVDESSEEYELLNDYFGALAFGEPLPLSSEEYLAEGQKPLTIKQLKDVNELIGESLDNIANDNTEETIASEKELIQDADFIKGDKAHNQKIIDYALKKLDEGIKELEAQKTPPPKGKADDNSSAKPKNNQVSESPIKGNGKLLAPNGKPSNLPPDLYKMVRTPKFKAWFGDWENDPEHASKVVDENGEPLVVFHGEPEWKNPKGKVALGTHAGYVFSSENLDMVYTYSSGNQKILTEGEKGSGVFALFVNIKKPYIVDAKMSHWGHIKHTYVKSDGTIVHESSTDAIRKHAKEQGYDGTIIQNVFDEVGGKMGDGAFFGTDYISYKPEQVKSALYNNGNFDPNDQNMHHSISVDKVKTRAYQKVLNEIQQAFPNAKFTYEGVNVFATLPNGAKIRISIKDNIILNEKQRKRAFKDHNVSDGVIQGFWKKFNANGCNRLLTVSRNSEVGTAFHEALHAAIDMALTEREKLALYRHYTEQAKLEGRDVEEVVADAYRDWVLGRKAEGKTTFGKLWQKVKDFARRMQAFFTNNEKAGVEKIFQDVESGKVYERGTEGTKIKRALYNVKDSSKEVAEAIKRAKPFIENAASSNIHDTLPMWRLTDKEVNAIKAMTGLNVRGYIHDIPANDIRHTLNDHSVETDGRHAPISLDDLKRIPDIIADPDAITLGTLSNSGEPSIRYHKMDKDGIVKVVEVVHGKGKRLSYKTMWKDLPIASDVVENNPTDTSENNNGPNPSTDNSVTQSDEEVKYSVAPSSSVESRLAGATKNSKPITAKEKVVAFKNNPKEWLDKQRKDFYINWVDKNDVFKDIDKLLAKVLGRKLDENEKIYGRAQGITSTSNGNVQVFIDGGREELAAMNKRLQNVKMKHPNGTMAQVLSNVKEDVLDANSKAFMKRFGFKDSVEALGSALGWRRLREMYNASLKLHDEWEQNGRKGEEPKPYALPNGLTIDDLNEGIAAIPKQFLKACDDYYDMNDNILCMLEDAGVISKELHQLLNDTYKEYCPLQRDFSDTQGLDDYLSGFNAGGTGPANVSNMIKKIGKEGSERTIINPLETTIQTIIMASRRAERNKVCQKLVKLADVPGMETVVSKVDPVGYEKDGSPKYPAADVKNSTFTVMENGKKITYKTSPDFYQAIVGYDTPSSSIAFDALALFAKGLRYGATMTPSFIVRNGFRDSVLAGYMTNVGFKPILGTINGIKKLHAKSGKEADINALFKTMGFGGMTRQKDGQAIYASLQKQVGSEKIDFTNPQSLWNAFNREILDRFESWNEDVELGTRRELFGLAIEKGYKDYQDGKITFEELVQQAAEVGRFGTTDFTRSGIKGQQVNRVAAFFNANVQGVDLFAQGLKNPETRWRMAGFIGTYVAMPCLFIWAANHDKDWWKELDPQTKYTNFCVSEYFRVPLPQEAGVTAGGGLMAILDAAYNKDPKAMGVWGKAVLSALTPNFIPTAFMPILEWQANYNFFRGKSIVNQRLQKLPDDMQYDNYTSEMSKALGAITGLSPKKIDNTVSDVGATLGTQMWDILGGALVMAMGNDKVRPDKDFREQVFVRDFNVTESKRGRYTNDFYDLWSEANKLKSGGRTNRRQESAIKSINAAQRVISGLNKEIREIGNPENTRLTSAQKQEMIRVRREKIKKVAKQATDKYGKYFE